MEPRYASIRDPQGRDSGRIHRVRITSSPAMQRTACDRIALTADFIPHSIGPTCKTCRAREEGK